jgi:hypothetical protein
MSTEPTDKFDDGGCAFPEIEYGSSGMTLRDYFAGQAMTIPDLDYLKRNIDKDKNARCIASFAYAVAYAMIAKRNTEI